MPFDIDTSSPADNMLLGQYPADERANRTTIKGGFGVEHDFPGEARHKFGIGDSAARSASISAPVAGNVWILVENSVERWTFWSGSAWVEVKGGGQVIGSGDQAARDAAFTPGGPWPDGLVWYRTDTGVFEVSVSNAWIATVVAGVTAELMLVKSTAQSGLALGTSHDVLWQSADYESQSGLWGGADTADIIVPAGVVYVEVMSSLMIGGTGKALNTLRRMDVGIGPAGVGFPAFGAETQPGALYSNSQASEVLSSALPVFGRSGRLQVSQNDYLRIRYQEDGSGNPTDILGDPANSWVYVRFYG